MTAEVVRERPLAGRSFFASWSGGKDAYLALERAGAAGGRPRALLCMLEEGGERSRGHGLPLEVVRAQADALGLSLVTRATTWDGYEEAFLDALAELRGAGIAAGVFGDIDLDGHREWVERICETAGLQSRLPLWKEPRSVLLDELLDGGVRATVVAVRADRLDASFLGRSLDRELVRDLEAAGVDACGEEGEYHTLVTDASLFAAAVPVTFAGVSERDDCLVLDVRPADPRSARLRTSGISPVNASRQPSEEKGHA